jgi:hypothetical protein
MKDSLVKQMLEAYEALDANQDELDRQLKAYIRSTWPKGHPRPKTIQRLGKWYPYLRNNGIEQRCVVRIYTLAINNQLNTQLKEYTIPNSATAMPKEVEEGVLQM